MGQSGTKTYEDLGSCVTEFSLDLYKQTVHCTGNVNVFISPSSVYVTMAMLHEGARNATLEQMMSSLKLDKLVEETDIVSEIQKFSSTFAKGSEHVCLHVANNIYPSKERTTLDSYIAVIKEHFDIDVKPIAFKTDPDGSRVLINLEVEEQTKYHIKELLPSGSITNETAMIVINAIYFKGMWTTPFDVADTRKDEFYESRKLCMKIDMMRKEFEEVRYAEGHSCKLLEIRYKGNELGMVILLPNDIDGLQTLESKLDFDTLSDIMRLATTENVNVVLPKFQLETSYEMQQMLMGLGMANAFDNTKADFSGIGERLFVSKVFHKAFLDVSEEGTEAAAATATIVVEESCILHSSRKREFIADHPFMFIIWNHRLGCPLFVGRFTGPSA